MNLVQPVSQSHGQLPRVTLYDHSYETFAVQYLSATLKQHGFPTQVFYDCSMNKDYLGQDFFLTNLFSLRPGQIARGILATRPQVVAFSIITVFYPLIAAIIAELRRRAPELIIVAGGPHCTLVPEEALKNTQIDLVFVGEADISLPHTLKLLAGHSLEYVQSLPPEELPGVANLWQGKPVLRGMGQVLNDLDQAPFPDKEPYYKKNPSLKIMYTATCSRGCLFRCTYCNSNNLRQMYHQIGARYFRVRSVDNVIEELKQAKAKYNPRYIMFIDNLFAPQTRWLERFSEKYRQEIGLPFFCETNPNVHSEYTMKLLAQAGCTLLQFGFQSANEEVRQKILHRRESNDRIRRLVKTAKRLGMLVCIDHIANLPGERKEHLTEAVEFYHELRPHWINLGFLQFYPRAEILDIALAHKILTPQEMSYIMRGEMQSSFRLLSKSKLGDFHRTLPMRFYAAFRYSDKWNERINRLLDNPTYAPWLSSFASPFIYVSRILTALKNPRDFLVRHHIIRNLMVMKILLREKFITYA